jgi:hypothetical protein
MTQSKNRKVITMFINYTVNNGLSIDTFRAPVASVTDLADIAEAITEGREENLTCSIEGNEIDVLEDGSYWNNSNASTESLEELHALIKEYDM